MLNSEWEKWEPTNIGGLERQLPSPDYQLLRDHLRFRLTGSPSTIEVRTEIESDGATVHLALVQFKGNGAPPKETLELINKVLTYYDDLTSWGLQELTSKIKEEIANGN